MITVKDFERLKKKVAHATILYGKMTDEDIEKIIEQDELQQVSRLGDKTKW